MNDKRKLVDDLILSACTILWPKKPGAVVEKFRKNPLLKELKAEDFQDVRGELLDNGPPNIIPGKPRIWRIF